MTCVRLLWHLNGECCLAETLSCGGEGCHIVLEEIKEVFMVEEA